jgi:hypothetical protein
MEIQAPPAKKSLSLVPGQRAEHTTVARGSQIYKLKMEIEMKIPPVICTFLCVGAFIGVNASSALAATTNASPSPFPTMLLQAAVEESRSLSETTSGVWLMTWTNKEKEIRHAVLQLQMNGETVRGTAKLEGGPIKGSFPLTGDVHGNRISFSVKVYGRQVSFTGTVDGNKMSGTTKEGAPWLAAHQ